jgi:hypothetical protein
MATNDGPFTRAYNAAARRVRQATRQSRATFQQMIDTLRGVDRERFRRSYRDHGTDYSQQNVNFNQYARANANQLRNNITQNEYGRTMVMFAYDAKWKDELRYWDRLPLIIPLGPAKGGFLGINFHYIPPKLRAHLLDVIYPSLGRDFNYQRLIARSRTPLVQHAVKHYLNNHVKTRFLFVPSEQWDRTLFLPFERFASRTGGPTDPRVIQRETVQKARRR